ncbi:MAG: peroxiredoxin-like family protein [Bacteroidota bacterium]
MDISAQDFKTMSTNEGSNIFELSTNKPVLLVFLRHFGCTFCREAMEELSKKKGKLAKDGIELVFVHMADDETADRYFKRYKLEGSLHISDPECELYQKFGLVKGNFNQLFGLNVWMRGIQAGVLQVHGIGSYVGDGFQMPGVFMIQNGCIREKFVHNKVSDKPDYERLAACCVA